jgi:tRNA(Ile)-lysidine synthase
MDLVEKTQNILREQCLISYGEKIIVGVSGGPDSTALLHILSALRLKMGLQLYVVHVNHQLRANSGRDEIFVVNLCRRLGIPCAVKRVQIKTSSKKSSLEEAAREKRFECLLAFAQQKKARTIALGHTQDDLAETVLMRILRGSGLLGLQGILPIREMQNTRIIRPFIYFSKKEILAYLQKHKIRFCMDPTNRQTKFFRNKIRLNLLPLLENHYQPNLREVLANLGESTANDYDFLQQEGGRHFKKLAKNLKDKQITLPLASLGRLHPALQRMVIRLAIQRLKGNLNQLSLTHMKEMESLIKKRPSGSRVDLPQALRASKQKSLLILEIRKT